MKSKNKKDGLTELIVSNEPQIIGSRFIVKASIYNDGFHDESIMVVISDCIENHFSIKFHKNRESVAMVLKLLEAATK
jgi:hypothetical protein